MCRYSNTISCHVAFALIVFLNRKCVANLLEEKKYFWFGVLLDKLLPFLSTNRDLEINVHH